MYLQDMKKDSEGYRQQKVSPFLYLTIKMFIVHSGYKHCYQVCVKVKVRLGCQ